jgi:hypothetical protein
MHFVGDRLVQVPGSMTYTDASRTGLAKLYFSKIVGITSSFNHMHSSSLVKTVYFSNTLQLESPHKFTILIYQISVKDLLNALSVF